jgi:tetratricopeptide (TPR) repeat protein
MKKMSLLCVTIFVALCIGGPPQSAAGAQQESKKDAFRNPAMEDQDEVNQAMNKGRMLMQGGDVDGAINAFKKAAALKSGDCAECFQLIGQAHFVTRDFKEAAVAYKQAIALKAANEAELHNVLGVVLYLQEDKKVLEEAVTAFKRAIEMSGGKLIKSHYNLGYALLKLGRDAEGKSALNKYLELDPSANNAGEVRTVIANPRMVNERFAPAFKVTSYAGEEISLDKLRGRIVLLDFWATWCGPCRVEMPEHKILWKRFGGENFIMIGVNIDHNINAFENYTKREEITWPQYIDKNGMISQMYGVRGIPHTVLIDQDGIIRGVGYRGSNLASKVEEMLKKLRKPATADSK